MGTSARLYSEPREVNSPEDCWFYHTMDLPGFGLVQGEWDLRGGVDDYLGHVNLQGKRVLEIGTASGFLCFEMEKRGANVVAYDLSENQAWDTVPQPGPEQTSEADSRADRMRKLNNSWWLAHRLFESRARMVYGSVYEIPAEIGPVHVSTLGCILLHLRDPLLALQRTAKLTRETVVVTDILWPLQIGKTPAQLAQERLQVNPDASDAASLWFYPNSEPPQPNQRFTWWHISPQLVVRFLALLGFEQTQVTYHTQRFGTPSHQQSIGLFTVVGTRPQPFLAEARVRLPHG